VLIYFGDEAQERLVKDLLRALTDDGLLLVARSEVPSSAPSAPTPTKSPPTSPPSAHTELVGEIERSNREAGRRGDFYFRVMRRIASPNGLRVEINQ